MPIDGGYDYNRYQGRGWKYMMSWQRKDFYRENESRVRRGLKPLPKPETVHPTHGV